MRLKIKRNRHTLVYILAAMCLVPGLKAFSPGDADTIMNVYNNTFYVGNNGNGYFKYDQSSGVTYFWGQAEEIEAVEDAWERSGNYQSMITSLLNGFSATNGTNWSSNIYNDDICWACIAYLRGYQATGNTTFRTLAKTNFDMMYARSWDTTLGGGLWWTTDRNEKNACVNGPAAIASYLLYKTLNDTTYLTKAQAIYNWEKTKLFNASTGAISDNMNKSGAINTWASTYNQGTFIGAANYLGDLASGTLAMNYTRDKMGTLNAKGQRILPEYGTNGNNSGFNGIGLRWFARFMKDQGLQSTYLPWLQANADAAWDQRRTSDNLSWCQWLHPTSTGTNLLAWDCISSVVALQVVPAPGGTGSAATVYQDCSFGGYAIGLAEGTYTTAQLAALGIKDNDISSLKVTSGYSVMLYDGDNCSGSSLLLQEDATCLVDDNFNDLASSIKIVKGSAPVATVYHDCSYGGYAVGLPVGTYTAAQLAALGVTNNDISALRVVSGYQATLYDGDNFTGNALVLTGETPCLAGSPKFNDKASSIKVEKKHLSEYINTLRGTNNEVGGFSRGNTAPLAALPHGFNFWTPLQDANAGNWIYQYGGTSLQGFGASHIPSPWISDYARIQFMPEVGTLQTVPANRAATFSHANEVAKAHYYSVYLDNGIKTEMAPTMHGCAVRFTFPSGASHLLFETRNGSAGSITVNQGAKSISGYTDDKGGKSGVPRLYFYAVLDKAIAAVGNPSSHQANVDFATGADEVVNMRIATSYISQAQAQANLSQEIGSKSFETVMTEGAAIWDKSLGQIELEGASEDQKTTFYSCFYRTLAYPNAMWETVNGTAQYASPFDGTVHTGKLYVNNGFWDTYKSTWPLYTLLNPGLTGDMLNGLVDAYKQSGSIPRWIAPGFVDSMVSTHYDVIFADAYQKGINFDAATAYEASVKDAMTYSTDGAKGRKGNAHAIFLGYVPNDLQGESAAWTLENSVCDAGIARMATKLGKTEDAEYFSKRALGYANIYSPTVGFFRGKNSDGSWRTSDSGFNPAGWWAEFTEGDAYQYRFVPAHDGQGLSNLFGGSNNMIAKLDETFSTAATYASNTDIHEMREAQSCNTGQYNHSNQPDHQLPYMYHYAGAPSKTASRVRSILTNLYGSGLQSGSEGNGYMGDEDNGSMSSWYLFSAMGLFPAQGGTPEYLIGSPLFKKATLHLENGKDFVISAPENSNGNIYVQSATLNGSNHDQSFLSHADLVKGGTLTLNMGSSPTSWGTESSDLPSSFTKGSNPPAPLMDYAHDGTPSASISNAVNGEGEAQAFDNNSQTKWFANAASAWIQYKLPQAKAIQMYTLTSANDWPTRDPKDWTLQGSNNGTTWTILDTRTNQNFPWRYQTRNFSITSRTPYLYYRLNITANHGEGNLQLAEMELLSDGQADNAPILIEAENYINMSGVGTETCSEGGLDVGWIDAGDWMVWDVNIPTAGTYTIQYRVASPNTGGVIQLEKAGGSPVYGSVNVPNTGGWQNWQTISHTVTLPAGQQQLAISMPTGGYNLNWIQISK